MEAAFEEQRAEMEKTCWRLHQSRAVMACTCRGEETERGNKLTASVMGHPLLQLLALTGSKGWASGRELADLQPAVRPCPRRGPARGLSTTPVENDTLAAQTRRWTPLFGASCYFKLRMVYTTNEKAGSARQLIPVTSHSEWWDEKKKKIKIAYNWRISGQASIFFLMMRYKIQEYNWKISGKLSHFNWMLRYKIEQYNSEISGQVSKFILMMRYKIQEYN